MSTTPNDYNPEKVLVILGAGRQGRVVFDVCLDLGIRMHGFLDDTKAVGTLVNGAPVLGGFDQWKAVSSQVNCEFLVALGRTDHRCRVSAQISAGGGKLATVIHPTCQVSRFARIGSGVFLNAFSRVCANAEIADYCLVEGLSTVGAETVLGEGVGTGPGVTLAGASQVGSGSFIGAGAVVAGRVRVGANSAIGANAAVIDDIPDGVLAVGTPARVKKRLAAPPSP